MDLPFIGHGLGLRTKHYPELVAWADGRSDGAADLSKIDWFEAISENFMVPGGNPRYVLRRVRERFPVVLHGVSLSLGSVDPLDERYLDELAALAAEIEPAIVSDPLCWGSHGGKYAHDLLPLPFTEDAIA